MTPSGGTATGEAIAAALRVAAPADRRSTSKPPAERDRAALRRHLDEAAATRSRPRRRPSGRSIPIYTVALGTPDGTITVPRQAAERHRDRARPARPAALAQIARASGGQTFTADNADGLERRLPAARLAARHRDAQAPGDRRASPAAALVLLLVGAGMSLRWFGRLV